MVSFDLIYTKKDREDTSRPLAPAVWVPAAHSAMCVAVCLHRASDQVLLHGRAS